MKLIPIVTILLFQITIASGQKLKYKSDVEPLLKGTHTINSVNKLSRYYSQNMKKDGTPTSEAMNYLRERLSNVCLHIGLSYENQAEKFKNYPTSDSAYACIDHAISWYQKVTEDLKIKNDTLSAHITKIKAQRNTWKIEAQKTINEIQELKESIKSNLTRLQAIDEDKAVELSQKHSKAILLNEYKAAHFEIKDALSDLEREQRMYEEKMKAAEERKAMLLSQMEKEKKQKTFLNLQNICAEENPCPNCPKEVAIEFRNAYYSGNIDKIKNLIIDYYGDEKLFYGKDVNLFKQLTAQEKEKLSLSFKAKTADFKRTPPANVVYFTDNEEQDFYIDKNYKSNFLHATVFKAINDFDKIDLIKYQGKWKVYRVGGAYGGRSGNTIANGKFFYDPKFLQKEIKMKKKK